MRAKLLAGILLLATLALLFGFAIAVFADHRPGGSHLVEVGPVNPENGFPVWYKDANGLALELCLDHQDPLCNFLPGDVPDPNSPISFPNNFPGEAFWWTGDALIDTNAAGDRALLVLALEAAFANENPIPGDQISFGRVRIWVDTTVPGTYTVTHPFGVDVFTNVPADQNGIKFTEDIGIGAAGDFTGALNSSIGPFLTWDPITDAPAGFVGNPLIEHRVTGSVFGTNFYRIEGPVDAFAGSSSLCADPALGADPVSTTDCIETDMFSVMGKIRTNAGVGVTTATYKNSAGPGPESLNVFAFSEASQVLQVSGPGIAITDMQGDGAGLYFARIGFNGSGPPPAQVTVTNTGDNPPAVVTVDVVDIVTITQAEYNVDTGQLTVTALSSDTELAPILSIYRDNAALIGTANAGNVFTASIAVPPPVVRVESAHGGAAEEPVTIVGANFTPTNLAPNVSISTPADGDSFVEGDPINFTGAAFDLEDGNLSAALAWSSTIDGPLGTGPSVTTALSPGVHTITATAIDSAGLPGSASIVVTITAAAGNTPPAATNDDAATTGMLPVTINILANDNDDVGIDPATVVVGAPAGGGTVAVDPVTGEITYTPNPATGSSPVVVGPIHPVYGYPVWYQDSSGPTGSNPATDVFTYTVKDLQGAISNQATVNITLNSMSLEHCLNPQDPLCNFLPGDLPDPNSPLSFPDNFPQESFWWSAEAAMPTDTGGNATLILAVAGGFIADGPVVDGNQESFARTRIRITGLTPGEAYAITHPYGVENLTADGLGEINFTADIGDGVADFTGALNVFPGPFLVWDATPPLPPAGYVGDPLVEHPVTGSPFGTNFFRVEGAGLPPGGIQTNNFLVMGKMTTPATGPGNTPPVAAITAPANGSTAGEGDTITFEGTAADAEEGDLSAGLVWTSDLDGQIGSGASFTAVLSVGSHTITAAVTDSGGLAHSTTVAVTVTPGNTAPVVSITTPAGGSTFAQGDTITFEGTAADAEDGDLSAGLVWTSDLDGQIGSGASFSTTALSAGTHTVTATATDSGALTGSATVVIDVTTPANTPPLASITIPAIGAVFTEGDNILFEGTAADTEDGDLSAGLVWTSDLDGQIGSGASFTAVLSVGSHTITAAATDSGNLTGSASVTIDVAPAPPADTIAITRVRFRTNRNRWVINGTGSSPGQFVTVFLNGTQIDDPVEVDVDGIWQFRQRNSTLEPVAGDVVEAVSDGGGTFSYTIRARDIR